MTQLKALVSSAATPTTEIPQCADNEPSEGEAEILELEARLWKAQEARRSRGAFEGLAVRLPATSLIQPKY